MHIILGLLAAISGAFYLINRLSGSARQVGDAANEIGNAAESLVNLPRRMGFRRRAGQTGLMGVEDPREAGAILMRLIVFTRENEPASPAERSIMERRVSRLFSMSADDARELFDYVDWVIRDTNDPRKPVTQMSKVLRGTQDLEMTDLADFDDILVELSGRTGAPTLLQTEMLGIFRTITGLKF